MVNAGVNPLVFPGLKVSTTSEDSKMINFMVKPKVIISASGMCDAGRIRHHLKHNLWRPECTVLFVGYQANGTLGRRLLEGEKNVKLFGEEIEVRCRIESLHGVSGHADKNGLLAWLKGFRSPIERVFVVHGEDTVTGRVCRYDRRRTWNTSMGSLSVRAGRFTYERDLKRRSTDPSQGKEGRAEKVRFCL